MSSELYVIIKPDAFAKGVWPGLVDEFARHSAALEMRLYCPSVGEILESYPRFLWTHDVLDDWIRCFANQLSLVLRLQASDVSMKQWQVRKGSTFNPSKASIRGAAGVTARVDNLLHTPSDAAENAALEAIFARRKATLSRAEVAALNQAMRTERFDRAIGAWISELRGRSGLHISPTGVFCTLDALETCTPGSAMAKVLMDNLETLLTHTGIPVTEQERFAMRQAAVYAVDSSVAMTLYAV